MMVEDNITIKANLTSLSLPTPLVKWNKRNSATPTKIQKLRLNVISTATAKKPQAKYFNTLIFFRFHVNSDNCILK